MDYNEALSELIDAVADVEEHGDAIEALQNYKGETDSDWKDKYLKLESEYKKRFKEKMAEGTIRADDKGESKDETEEITVEDLDFNGKTE